MNLRKQPALKPQDIVVALKIALARELVPSFAQLSRELHMSVSEVHGATQRALASRLLETSDSLRANRSALHEFLIHGVMYAFPAVEGPVMRGLPTGVSAPVLKQYFDHSHSLPIVWPDAGGEERGTTLCPLYASVPAACREDAELYEALALLDAVRAGAARERELAGQMLIRLLV